MKYTDMKMYEQAETNLLLMYSNVRQVEPGIFGIMENGKYGFADARKPDIKRAKIYYSTVQKDLCVLECWHILQQRTGRYHVFYTNQHRDKMQ